MEYYLSLNSRNSRHSKKIIKLLKESGFTTVRNSFESKKLSVIEQDQLAIQAAEFILVILPEGKGNLVEIGGALSLNKKIFLYAPTKNIFDFNKSSILHKLPEVALCIGKPKDLIQSIKQFYKVREID